MDSDPKVSFGSDDGDPVLWSPGEAWAVRDGAWRPVDSASMGMSARILSKSDFDAKFPSLPTLPAKAFHSGVKPSKIEP